MIATPHVGLVDPRWIDALLHLEKPAGWYRGALIRMEIAHARNLLAQKFLENADATHLLFWDDDVLPPSDGLMRLLAHDQPIVSGFYTSRALPMRPIAYRRDAVRQRYEHVDTLTDGLQAVDGVGCGFLLIQRSVFERIEPPWFQYLCEPGDLNASLSEDLFFCERARAAGIPILLDTSVRCGHIGSYTYDYRDLMAAVSVSAGG